ncbi:hypothetical protein BOTBODRAFT_182492 [Botryobasidium botryosum FD-172 SS1]|uniref:Uncharacterized protein n=1 Tax=Botryobasidium botryosum (strain FD-172 SS1) TaxID=930990 RepID=A0A067LTG0_BOTB1|nr:hypothetical protein BOTBODRAFT_182492 [Botryobasidium botryosum FD-172 SS1]
MPPASSSLPTPTPEPEVENFSTPTSARTMQPPPRELPSEISPVDELSGHLSQLGLREPSSNGSRETPPAPRPSFPGPFPYQLRRDSPPHCFLSAPAPSIPRHPITPYAHPNPWSPPPQDNAAQPPYQGTGTGPPHFQPHRRRTQPFENGFTPTPTPPPAPIAPPPPPPAPTPPPQAPGPVLNLADPAVQQALATIVQIVQQGRPAHTQEPKVPDVDTFYGNSPRKAREFIRQCEFVFMAQPS